jgi:ATP-binding cassette subfamily B protein
MSTFSAQDDDFKAKLDAGLWWKIFRRALHLKRFLVPLFFASLILAACDASFAFVTRWVIDGVIQDGVNANFTLYATVYFSIILTLCVCVWAFIFLAGNISNRLAHDIRRDSFDRLQELEFAFFDTRPVGWLISRLTSDCDRLARTIAWGFLDIIWGLSFVLMIAIGLLVLNWKLGLVVLSVVPPLALISRYFQKRLLFSARDVRKHNSQITARYNESIQGVRTTKTLVREAENLNEFKQLSDQMFFAAVLNARQNATYFPIVVTLGSLAAGLALWYGGWMAVEEVISLGTLIAVVNFAGMLFQPINQLAQRLAEIQAAQAAGERIMALLETEPTIKDNPAVAARIALSTTQPSAADAPFAPDGLPAQIETIEFRNVTFSYSDGTPVLTDFNLKVAPGESIALVGPSGGGKSTIVSLVCRFYEPVSGEILINGVDYRERGLAWLQSQLGIVLQTPHLFKGTIRENIRYGRLDATDAEVEKAAQMVNAHEFISETPGGYDSSVGEGGNQLSTGQRQLISFARALLANPQIFVMDEATSSIDTETEQLIQRGLESVLTGRISFVIAHRLSTIRRAHRILVITKGKIEESGSHEELLRERGHYYDLYTNQFRREREEEVLSGEAT